jgi:hypothetical protein
MQFTRELKKEIERAGPFYAGGKGHDCDKLNTALFCPELDIRLVDNLLNRLPDIQQYE